MKYLYVLLIALVSLNTFAQEKDYNIQKGYAAEGYDVTEYFNNNAIEGNKKIVGEYEGVKYKFVSQTNLDKFNTAPEKYTPQYGGYCAYAMSQKGKKVSINPETFEIKDGKLYLFYNSWGTNTLEKWNEEGAEILKGQADAAWSKVRFKAG